MNTRVLGVCVPGTTLTLVGLARPVLTLWVSTSVTQLGEWEWDFKWCGTQSWEQVLEP